MEEKPGAVLQFVHDHPYITCLFLLTVAPLLLGVGLWLYLHLTVSTQIEQELRALKLPVNGLELETWNHPADHGGKEFLDAMREMDAVETRIGSDEFNRLIDNSRVILQTAAAIKSGSYTPPDPLEFSTRPEDRKLLHERIAASYREDQTALENLFREVAPIQTKMAEAARHGSIVFPGEYRNGMETRCEGLMSYRYYALAQARQAEYEAFAGGNGDAALARLQTVIDFNRRFHAYIQLEHLILIAADNTTLKAADRVIAGPGLSGSALRSFGARLMDDTQYAQFRQNLPNAISGEFALVQNCFQSSQSAFETLKNTFSESVLLKIIFLTTQDLDHRECANEFLDMYRLVQRPFPQIRPELAALTPSPALRICHMEPAFDWRQPFLITAMNSPRNRAYALLQNHYRTYAMLLETGIGATLAGERLEGKPWPQDLADPRFPHDPFTGQAFRLLIDDDSVYVWSPGADGRDSGMVPVFHRTGCMKDNHDVPSTMGEDDIVFRLPRALYDSSAGKGRSEETK